MCCNVLQCVAAVVMSCVGEETIDVLKCLVEQDFSFVARLISETHYIPSSPLAGLGLGPVLGEVALIVVAP